MPNHVTTILTAPDYVIDSIINQEGADIRVDFDLIVPSPPNKETTHCSGEHDPGVICWVGWNRENWGTKWNAYDAERVLPACAQFETAWTHPFPVIKALSYKNPDVVIHIRYADENLGHNFGEYWIRDGEITLQSTLPADGTDEARDWACQVNHRMTYAELEELYG